MCKFSFRVKCLGVLVLILFFLPVVVQAIDVLGEIPDFETEYTIKNGDTLSQISFDFYKQDERGRGAHWIHIYEYSVGKGYINPEKQPIVPYGKNDAFVKIFFDDKISIPFFKDEYPSASMLFNKYGISFGVSISEDVEIPTIIDYIEIPIVIDYVEDDDNYVETYEYEEDDFIIVDLFHGPDYDSEDEEYEIVLIEPDDIILESVFDVIGLEIDSDTDVEESIDIDKKDKENFDALWNSLPELKDRAYIIVNISPNSYEKDND